MRPVTLFVGSDAQSNEALKIVKDAGIALHVIDSDLGYRDFDTPLLVSAWGVFDGLKAIAWFTEVASQPEPPAMARQR